MKANVPFFDRKPASETLWTSEIVEDLEAALAEFAQIAATLGGSPE